MGRLVEVGVGTAGCTGTPPLAGRAAAALFQWQELRLEPDVNQLLCQVRPCSSDSPPNRARQPVSRWPIPAASAPASLWRAAHAGWAAVCDNTAERTPTRPRSIARVKTTAPTPCATTHAVLAADLAHPAIAAGRS